jgi:diguanylate cyclase (GGDEF)-like protein/PAS domain S-box-containing protein
MLLIWSEPGTDAETSVCHVLIIPNARTSEFDYMQSNNEILPRHHRCGLWSRAARARCRMTFIDGQSGRSNPGTMVAIGLAAVLIILPGLAFWSAVSTYWAGQAARHATEVSDAFEQARYYVGAEESLERKYRIEPSPEVRRQHRMAATSLIDWLQQAQVLSPAVDGAMVKELLAKHVVYLSAIQRMFAAVDAGDATRAKEIDETEADPAFDDVETIVDDAAGARRIEAREHLRDLAGVQTKILIATPIVMVPGIALVVLFWLMLSKYRRDAVEAALRETATTSRNEKRFRSLVQSTSDVILICAAEGRITYCSPIAKTGWGYSNAGLLGQGLSEFVHADDEPALRELWQQSLNLPGADRRTEMRLRDAGGVWRPTEMILINLLQEPGVEGIVATVRDITDRKAFEEQLTRQAFYDSLTSLPNRALFQDRLAQAMDRAHRRQGQVGLLFIDLDNFKLVNDSLGHHLGDVLLAEAAARLQACVRVEDTVARLGGDEFVILLHQVTEEADALLMAERVAQQFGRPFTLNGRDVVVTASVGIALEAAGHEAADSLLRNADVAMYRAKTTAQGRHVVFEASMHSDALMRLELESDLRHALERGEFRVHYQPIISLRSGRIVEAEALVRWLHPTRGLVAPSDFVPIAEETGLIVPLGQWVLEQACRQAAVWQAAHPTDPPLTMSVNLSPRQFQQPTLVEQVIRALNEAGLAPGSLKLEITEGVAMRDAEATIIVLERLKQLGVLIAIDDFGTGYSSLAYLRRLPLDVLKIDRSFVTGAGENQEDTAIVRAIISLAHSLELTITAEGIETTRQALLMQSWGCERGQGYYWSQPVDTAMFTTILAAGGRCASSYAAA